MIQYGYLLKWNIKIICPVFMGAIFHCVMADSWHDSLAFEWESSGLQATAITLCHQGHITVAVLTATMANGCILFCSKQLLTSQIKVKREVFELSF